MWSYLQLVAPEYKVEKGVLEVVVVVVALLWLGRDLNDATGEETWKLLKYAKACGL